MNMDRGIGRIALGIVLAAGLGGCASSPDGLRYADGRYYSAGEGRGDYYVGRAYDNVRYLGDPFFDDFLWPYDGGSWYGSWYGSPFWGYGGYCSVRYRYCPRGGWAWSDPFPRQGFDVRFGDPWRDRVRWREGYKAQPRDRARPPRPRQAPAPRGGADEAPPDWPRENRPPPREPDARPPRRVRDPMSNDGDEALPRIRRAAPPARDPPPPRPRDEDGN